MNWFHQLISDDPFTIKKMVERLNAGRHFIVPRFGDGEFSAMIGREGANCDGHQYFKDMGKWLRESFLEFCKDQSGKTNVCVGLATPIEAASMKWLSDHGLANKVYSKNDVFYRALESGIISQLFKSLRSKPVIMVGPERLRNHGEFPMEEYIPIPLKNCWEAAESVILRLENIRPIDKVIIFTAGPAAPVMIHKLAPFTKTTMIDLGSVLDPSVGLQTRGMHKRLK